MNHSIALGKTVWHRQTNLKGMVIGRFKAGGVRVHTEQGRMTWRRSQFKRCLRIKP